MKKEGRSGTARDGSWRILLSRFVADGKLGGGGRRLVGRVEGESETMEGGGSGRGGSGRGLAGWRQNIQFRPPPPASEFHFHGLLKISQIAISFSFPPYPGICRHGTAGLPTPGSSSNTYVHITFSFRL